MATWQSMFERQVEITKAYRERLEAAEEFTLKVIMENNILQETLRQMMENQILTDALTNGPITEQ